MRIQGRQCPADCVALRLISKAGVQKFGNSSCTRIDAVDVFEVSREFSDADGLDGVSDSDAFVCMSDGEIWLASRHRLCWLMMLLLNPIGSTLGRLYTCCLHPDRYVPLRSILRDVATLVSSVTDVGALYPPCIHSCDGSCMISHLCSICDFGGCALPTVKRSATCCVFGMFRATEMPVFDSARRLFRAYMRIFDIGH